MVDMEVLLELQDLDLELESFRRERKELPAALEELEAEYGQAGEELEAREAGIKALKLAIREAEGKVTQLDEAQNKYKTQLLTVKTNREYSALLTEIESVKKEKEEHEDAIIQKMSEVEAAEAELGGAREKLAEIQGRLNGKRGELNGKLKDLDGQIGMREQKHRELATRVPANVMGLYRRIMGSKVSQAVVSVRNGSCGGCFAHIPLQKVSDIRQAKQIYTCDYCGRILYYDNSDGK